MAQPLSIQSPCTAGPHLFRVRSRKSGRLPSAQLSGGSGHRRHVYATRRARQRFRLPQRRDHLDGARSFHTASVVSGRLTATDGRQTKAASPSSPPASRALLRPLAFGAAASLRAKPTGVSESAIVVSAELVYEDKVRATIMATGYESHPRWSGPSHLPMGAVGRCPGDIPSAGLRPSLGRSGLPGWPLSEAEESSSDSSGGCPAAHIQQAVEQQLGRSIDWAIVFDDPIPGGVRTGTALRCRASWKPSTRSRLPTCVASSGSHEKMRFTLGRTGLFGRFDGRIFSVDQVARGKPAPDVFLFAAARMGASPDRCAVVEDSVSGVTGALAAGMSVFAFTGGVTSSEALSIEGAVTFDRMGQLPALLRTHSGDGLRRVPHRPDAQGHAAIGASGVGSAPDRRSVRPASSPSLPVRLGFGEPARPRLHCAEAQSFVDRKTGWARLEPRPGRTSGQTVGDSRRGNGRPVPIATMSDRRSDAEDRHVRPERDSQARGHGLACDLAEVAANARRREHRRGRPAVA